MKKIPHEGAEVEIGIVGDAEAEVTFDNLSKGHFADRLITQIKKKKSFVCVGLDPVLSHLPKSLVGPITKKYGFTLEAVSKCFLDFCVSIIDSVHDVVPAVKPQIAFFEQYGFYGMLAYEQVCKYAREKGLIVIADSKVGDIGTTARAYADYFLGEVDVFGEKKNLLSADAVTINPYMGYDSIRPFVENARKFGNGAFVLTRTSNPSAGDLQDRGVEGSLPMYEMVAQIVEVWGADDIGECGYSSVGAVVGATYPNEAKKLRKLMPHQIFLVPGYGAQGGTAKDVKPCFNKDGTGAIINSARGIIYAYQNDDADTKGERFQDASRKAVKLMTDDLNNIL